MSLVAGRTVTPSAEDVPDTDDGGEKVTAGSFWPEIALSDVRMEMRINGAVTTSRLKQVGEKNLLKPLRETAEAISRELGFVIREG